MPKFDRVMVGSFMSAGDTLRLRVASLMRFRSSRSCWAFLLSTRRRIGTISPSGVSTAMARSTRSWMVRSSFSPSYQALSSGSARQPATMARTMRTVMSWPGIQPWMSASSKSVHSATSLRDLVMLACMARRGPRRGSATPYFTSVRFAGTSQRAAGAEGADAPPWARRTSSSVTVSFLPVACTPARSTPSSLALMRTEGSAFTRTGSCFCFLRMMAVSATTALLVGTLPTTVPLSSAMGVVFLASGAAFWAAASSFLAGAAPSPAMSKSTRAEWVGMMSPALPWSFAILPLQGEGTSTTAFAVSTDSSGWSTLTVSPSFTCQLTISASCRPSPKSGRLNVFID